MDEVGAFQGQTDMAAYINLSDIGRLRAPVGGTGLATTRAITNIDAFIAHHRHESRTIAALRNALLPELLSGRLRAPEARENVERVV